MVKLLLVEDDANLGQILQEYLQIKGYDAMLFRDGEQAWLAYKEGGYEFCIFDIMLPKLDGFALAERVRAVDTKIPIIFLTAKSMKEDTIHGLQIGADDYMTKPFKMEELLLRMQAIMRRSTPATVPDLVEFKLGQYRFLPDTQWLMHQEYEQHLTSKESELLKILCQYKNQMLDRNIALKKIWGNDSYFNARSMDVYITKLRKYLRYDPALQIINVHGQGFKLVEVE